MQLAIDFTKENISTLDGLNDRQLEAVTHKDGPLLIIAGAGTGKTMVATRRIAHIIEQGWAKPNEILALTFTEKAAAEMEERVDRILPYGCFDMWIETFHAFGDRLIRDYSIELGLPANFKVLTGTEQAIFMRQNLYKFDLKHFRPLSNPTSHIEALLTHFSRLKDELIAPTDYIDFTKKRKRECQTTDDLVEAEKTLELANAYKRYQELMVEAGKLDFGDLIYLCHKLLRNHKNVLSKLQSKFKFVLVDEFQDTNYAQNEIVKLLAAKHRNVSVVGDDDQSIYRFRGASISNILDFKNTYPDAKEVVLTSNYRSTQEILDTAYTLIQNNNPDRLEVKSNINKRLTSDKHGPAPDLIHCDTLSSEADTVAAKIKELKKGYGLDYKDFAILVRANSQAIPFTQSLNLIGVPFIYTGSSSLFDQPEIKMLIALLKVLAYTDDSMSFYELATSEIYSISPNTLAEIYSATKRNKRSIFAMLDYQMSTQLEIDDSLVGIYKDIIKYRDESKNLNVGELLYKYLSDKEFLKKLSETPSLESEHKIKNISKFFDRVNQFINASSDHGLMPFLNTLEMMMEYGDEVAASDIDPDIDAVNILTIHGAKGLEWEVVFVVNMVSDRFPSRKKREQIEIPIDMIKERLPEGDFHLEEERRLFYVGITRARQALFFTSAYDYGGKRKKKVSPFIFEALPGQTTDPTAAKPSTIEKIKRFDRAAPVFARLPYKFKLEPMKLSRAQIDDYITCPRQFYFKNVLQIPQPESHALIYGTAIHAALGLFFSGRMRNLNISLEEMITHFKQTLKGVGFESLEHEKDRREAGVKTLTDFYEEAKKDNRTPIAVESPFAFANKSVIVNGRYDLIYNNAGLPEVCDFKTSNVQTQEKADEEIKHSNQMKIYALSWYKKHGVIPKATLHFVEYRLKAEKIFTLEELTEVEALIMQVVEGIKKQEFIPTPDHVSCRWCAFRDICPDAMR